LVFVDLHGDGPTSGTPAAEPERIPFGYTAHSLPAMIAAVHGGIDDAAGWKETIGEEAETFLYNPGSAAKYLARHLRRFARRESHPDWLSLERRPWVGTGEEGEVERHLERMRTWAERKPNPYTELTYNEIAEELAPGQELRAWGASHSK